jgi:hypothetical protein
MAFGALFILASLPCCFVWLAFGATAHRFLRTERALGSREVPLSSPLSAAHVSRHHRLPATFTRWWSRAGLGHRKPAARWRRGRELPKITGTPRPGAVGQAGARSRVVDSGERLRKVVDDQRGPRVVHNAGS